MPSRREINERYGGRNDIEGVQDFLSSDYPRKDIMRIVNDRDNVSSDYLNSNRAERLLYNEEDMEDVEESFKNIVMQLQKLLIDAAILERSSNIKDIDSNWEDLADISSFALVISERAFDNNRNSSSEFAYKLGDQFGRVFSALTGKSTEDSRGARFYAGFSNRYTEYNDVDAERPDRSQTLDIETTYEYDRFGDKVRQDPEEVFNSTTIEKIKNYGYEPVDWLIVEATPAERNNVGSYSRGYLQLKRDPLIDNRILNFLEYKCGVWFGMVIDIHHKIKEEWENIEKASVSGLHAKNALKQFWEIIKNNSNDASSVEVARKCSTNKRQVTHVFNKLSIERKSQNSKTDRTLLHNVPIVRYDDNWKLTAYGQLLCYYYFYWDGDPTKIHFAALSKKANISLMGASDKEYEVVRQALMQFYDVDVSKHF